MKMTCRINGDKGDVQRLKRNVNLILTPDDSDSDNQEETNGKRHYRKKDLVLRGKKRKKAFTNSPHFFRRNYNHPQREEHYYC